MDLAQAQITAQAPRELKLLIEELSEVDTLGRSVERAPSAISADGSRFNHGLVKTPLLRRAVKPIENHREQMDS